MIEKIIEWSARNMFLVLLLTICTLHLGHLGH